MASEIGVQSIIGDVAIVVMNYIPILAYVFLLVFTIGCDYRQYCGRFTADETCMI